MQKGTVISISMRCDARGKVWFGIRKRYIKYQVQHKHGIYMAIVLKYKQIKEGERAVINSFGYTWL